MKKITLIIFIILANNFIKINCKMITVSPTTAKVDIKKSSDTITAQTATKAITDIKSPINQIKPVVLNPEKPSEEKQVEKLLPIDETINTDYMTILDAKFKPMYFKPWSTIIQNYKDYEENQEIAKKIIADHPAFRILVIGTSPITNVKKKNEDNLMYLPILNAI